MRIKIVIDTNIMISALLRGGGFNRRVIQSCLKREFVPLMSNALFYEYESVIGREKLFLNSMTTPLEREEVINGLMAVCEWVDMHYLWRPNLRDEADNHVLELANAGNARWLVTQNKKDFHRTELQFPHIRIVDAREFWEQKENEPWRH